MELFEPKLEVVELVVQHHRHAGSYALLVAARDVERYGANAVAYQLVEQVYACKSGIAEGEIETVADSFVKVFVVDYGEAVVGKHLFHRHRVYAEIIL